MQLRRVIFISVILLYLFWLTLLILVKFVSAQQEPTPCPVGSYSIGTEKDGEHICKLEPTGCPYGDSISLGPDCDKHKPTEVTPVYEPLIEYTGPGK